MLWSAVCLPGLHLPIVAALDGTFAEHGLDVEILNSPAGSDRVKALESGEADFCLTAINYYLDAVEELGEVRSRFTSVVHGRSSITAIVRADSSFESPQDLAGAKFASNGSLFWLLAEYDARVRDLGIAPPRVVQVNYGDAPRSLASGRIDAMVTYADLLPLVRESAGIPLRVVDPQIDVYDSGVIVRDCVEPHLVAAMRAAISATLARQTLEPERGLDALTTRYPIIRADHALESWRLLEPYVSCNSVPGHMDEARWERTLAWKARVHDLRRLDPVDVMVEATKPR